MMILKKRKNYFHHEQGNKFIYLFFFYRVIYEKENKLREEIQTLVDQLGTHTVKYNEAIIDKINSKNELKQLKDNRNKLIGQKSKLENQLENERVR
jgi:hypothetical protein